MHRLVATAAALLFLACGTDETPARRAPEPRREPTATRDRPDPADRALADAERAAEAKRCDASLDPERAVRRDADVVYATLGGRPLHVDVVRPDRAGPHPVVVLFHGGAFRRGDEDYMGGVARRLARLGYASAAVEYRLIGGDEGDFPDGVADARCAVRFLRAEADRFEIDGARVAAIGFSAGGYFAASLALQADDASLDGDCPLAGDASVRGAVAYFAPLDLREEAAWSRSVDALFEDVLGHDPARDPDLARRASPAAGAEREDPPLLVIAGTEDRIVPLEHGRASVATMRRAGARVELVEAPRAGHGFGLGGDGDPAEATCATVAFLEGVLSRG